MSDTVISLVWINSINTFWIFKLDTYASEYDLTAVNGYTGMVVSLVIVILGLYMIINIRNILEEGN